MKNYLDLSKEDLTLAKELLLKDITKDFVGKEIISTKYGDGIIKLINDLVEPPSVSAFSKDRTFAIVSTISFKDEEKVFHLSTAIKTGSIKFKDENLINLFNEYTIEADRIYEKVKIKELEEEKIREELRQKEYEEKERLAKIEKAQIKAEQRKIAQIDAAKKMSAQVSHRSGNNYYFSLGWIAKHATNFVAAMPDYLDNWFIKHFGNVPHRSVDQTKLSPSGLPSQFALYFKIEVDTNENIPQYLVKHLGDVKKDIKPISDTPFIFDIMINEGFVFGKAKDQDLDKILENIPNEYLSDFHAGYAL